MGCQVTVHKIWRDILILLSIYLSTHMLHKKLSNVFYSILLTSKWIFLMQSVQALVNACKQYIILLLIKHVTMSLILKNCIAVFSCIYLILFLSLTVTAVNWHHQLSLNTRMIGLVGLLMEYNCTRLLLTWGCCCESATTWYFVGRKP